MRPKQKVDEAIPQEFHNCEEAAESWDSHDTTQYLADTQPVKVKSEMRERHFEISSKLPKSRRLRKFL
jgi:hypothetical protein